jgi:hypothetical protein
MIGLVGRQGLWRKKVRRNMAGRNCHGRLHSCQAQVSNVRERHNINVYRPRHDVEEIMFMSDLDDDKYRSRYI